MVQSLVGEQNRSLLDMVESSLGRFGSSKSCCRSGNGFALVVAVDTLLGSDMPQQQQRKVFWLG